MVRSSEQPRLGGSSAGAVDWLGGYLRHELGSGVSGLRSFPKLCSDYSSPFRASNRSDVRSALNIVMCVVSGELYRGKIERPGGGVKP